MTSPSLSEAVPKLRWEYAFIMPDEQTVRELELIRATFARLDDRQATYAWHCINSWGIKSGVMASIFLRALRKAAKKALHEFPSNCLLKAATEGD